MQIAPRIGITFTPLLVGEQVNLPTLALEPKPAWEQEPLMRIPFQRDHMAEALNIARNAAGLIAAQVRRPDMS